MHFPLFKIPETRLLVMGNEIVQVTLNYRWQVGGCLSSGMYLISCLLATEMKPTSKSTKTARNSGATCSWAWWLWSSVGIREA